MLQVVTSPCEGIKKTVLLSVWSLVHPGIGHTALALQHAKAAIKSGLADRRALFLVLSGLAQLHGACDFSNVLCLSLSEDRLQANKDSNLRHSQGSN